MDLQEIDKAAEANLVNGVKDIRIGRFVLAAWAHSACGVTQTARFSMKDIKEGTVGEVLIEDAGIEPKDQDMLFTTFDLPVEGLVGFDFYPEDDLVIAYHKEEYEFFCKMTIANFWRYLNTIPNIYQFASPEAQRNRPTKEGLFLLSRLAQHT